MPKRKKEEANPRQTLKIYLIYAGRGTRRYGIADWLNKQYRTVTYSIQAKIASHIQDLLGIDREILSRDKDSPILDRRVELSNPMISQLVDILVKDLRTSDGRDTKECGYQTTKIHGNDVLVSGDDGSPLFWTPNALIRFFRLAMMSVDSDFWMKKMVLAFESTTQFQKQTEIIIPDIAFKSEIEFFQRLENSVEHDIKVYTVKMWGSDSKEHPYDEYEAIDIDGDYGIQYSEPTQEFKKAFDEFVLGSNFGVF